MAIIHLTPEQKAAVKRLVREDVRFRGMNLEEAEQLAWQILYKFSDDAKDFINELSADLKDTWKKLQGE